MTVFVKQCLTYISNTCIGWLVSNIDFPVKGVIILNVLAIIAISIGMSTIVYKVRYYFSRLGEK